MSLSEKYGIPPEKIKALIKDGFISCSIPNYEDLYKMFNERRATSGKSKHSICLEIAAIKNCSYKTVENAIKKLE